ncbi:MAG: hypothetical protein WB760_27910 [Xanthobacteraceae bacterium]
MLRYLKAQSHLKLPTEIEWSGQIEYLYMLLGQVKSIFRNSDPIDPNDETDA